MTQQRLRIVFMGTPEFAVESLKVLVENNYDIAGVITAPDKPAGRGQKLRQTPVKEYAQSRGLTVLQPTNLKDPAFVEELRALGANLQVIVAFRMLPEVVWAMPQLGSFNLHASLLPQYRGAAPINWAVINGDAQTGATTFFLRHEIDTGNVILQEKIDILPSDNAGSVHDKLMVMGAQLVLNTVQAIEAGQVTTHPQEHLAQGEVLRPAPKIFKETCKIDWHQPAVAVHNLIRGLSPYPAAWCDWAMPDGTLTQAKIFESALVYGSPLMPGHVESDGKERLVVGCADGAIEIRSIQLAGKKQVTVQEFLRGHKIAPGTKI